MKILFFLEMLLTEEDRGINYLKKLGGIPGSREQNTGNEIAIIYEFAVLTNRPYKYRFACIYGH